MSLLNLFYIMCTSLLYDRVVESVILLSALNREAVRLKKESSTIINMMLHSVFFNPHPYFACKIVANAFNVNTTNNFLSLLLFVSTSLVGSLWYGSLEGGLYLSVGYVVLPRVLSLVVERMIDHWGSLLFGSWMVDADARIRLTERLQNNVTGIYSYNIYRDRFYNMVNSLPTDKRNVIKALGETRLDELCCRGWLYTKRHLKADSELIYLSKYSQHRIVDTRSWYWSFKLLFLSSTFYTTVLSNSIVAVLNVTNKAVFKLLGALGAVMHTCFGWTGLRRMLWSQFILFKNDTNYSAKKATAYLVSEVRTLCDVLFEDWYSSYWLNRVLAGGSLSSEEVECLSDIEYVTVTSSQQTRKKIYSSIVDSTIVQCEEGNNSDKVQHLEHAVSGIEINLPRNKMLLEEISVCLSGRGREGKASRV